MFEKERERSEDRMRELQERIGSLDAIMVQLDTIGARAGAKETLESVEGNKARAMALKSEALFLLEAEKGISEAISTMENGMELLPEETPTPEEVAGIFEAFRSLTSSLLRAEAAPFENAQAAIEALRKGVGSYDQRNKH